jgi:hypothetical protein
MNWDEDIAVLPNSKKRPTLGGQAPAVKAALPQTNAAVARP